MECLFCCFCRPFLATRGLTYHRSISGDCEQRLGRKWSWTDSARLGCKRRRITSLSLSIGSQITIRITDQMTWAWLVSGRWAQSHVEDGLVAKRDLPQDIVLTYTCLPQLASQKPLIYPGRLHSADTFCARLLWASKYPVKLQPQNTTPLFKPWPRDRRTDNMAASG